MLNVKYKLDDSLVAALQQISSDASVGPLLVVMQDEVMKPLAPAGRTLGSVQKDLDAVRKRIHGDNIMCVFVVVRVAPNEIGVITYVNDDAKPRDRLMYSSGTAHLQDAVKAPRVLSAQTSVVDGIKPTMFQRTETDAGREELMTESERRNAEIAKMEVAPQPSCLPGVSMKVSKDAAEVQETLSKFADGQVDAASFKMDGEALSLDRKVSGVAPGSELEAAKEMLPADQPRFVLTYATKSAKQGGGRAPVMVYVCPDSCKPKEKMTYASTKASFVKMTAEKGIQFYRRIETSGRDEFISTVQYYMEDVEDVPEEPRAPAKPAGAKGPRMLI